MSRRATRSVVIYIAIACALAWLVALPLWLGEGLKSPLFPVVSIVMMATPATAALIVTFFVDRDKGKAQLLGLWPLTPLKRLLTYAALGILVSIALALVALPIGSLFGVYHADLTHFSALQELLDSQAGSRKIPISTATLVVIQLVSMPMAAFLNAIPALGEELGWRGWLLPKLLPLGTVPALLISGIVWGLWHAPLILLGYNYPGTPGWLAMTCMVIMCILMGGVFGWLRLRSASVWPSALAHGALNAAAGSFLLFATAGEAIDTTQATILGWTGWIAPLLLVMALLVTGQIRPAATAVGAPGSTPASAPGPASS